MSKTKWECFRDYSCFDMFAVRPVDDRRFESPRLFHVSTQEKAEQLCELLNDCHCATLTEVGG